MSRGDVSGVTLAVGPVCVCVPRGGDRARVRGRTCVSI